MGEKSEERWQGKCKKFEYFCIGRIDQRNMQPSKVNLITTATEHDMNLSPNSGKDLK